MDRSACLHTHKERESFVYFSRCVYKLRDDEQMHPKRGFTFFG